MLREIHISQLAVIESLSLELSDGVNCFTGETGAGKSLILGAFELLLGLRTGNVAEFIRAGSDEAKVTGVFEVHDEAIAQLASETLDQTIDAGESLLISRRLFSSGRSSYSVNGQPATIAMVRRLGDLLVDIHGQHDHQYLLKPGNQLHMLDAFGDALPLRSEFTRLHSELRHLLERKAELKSSDKLRRQQLDLYEFQADEIDAADPSLGEYIELKARHDLLANLESVKKGASEAQSALYDADGSVLERLQMIVHVLRDLAEHDEPLVEIAENVRTSTLSLQEAAFDLSRYVDRLDYDPAENAEIEDRLNTLNRLISKYASQKVATKVIAAQGDADDPLDEVVAYRAQIQQEIDTLRTETEDQDAIDDRIRQLRTLLQSTGQSLTKARRAAAAKLKPLIEQELRDLGMADARLEADFKAASSNDHATSEAAGTSTDNATHRDEDTSDTAPGGASGLETLELMIRTNPGQPARPLRRTASGGELSRIMLAIKGVIAQRDRVSVLVFDEIDANIGGRLGAVIGQKMRNLASPQAGRQVLCITHLPQIAAFAHRHLRVAKAITGKGAARQTVTTVLPLEGESRIDELAAMLAGTDATTTTRQQVKEMIAAAH